MRCKRGIDDFMVKPSHIVFLCLIYPIVGVVLAAWTSGNNALPLLFPLVSGFALIGPFAAIGLYEISRRREAGHRHVLVACVRGEGFAGAAGHRGRRLDALRDVHRLAADRPDILPATVRPRAAQLDHRLPQRVLATPRGWTLIILGHAIGFVFAVIVLATTVVAFPLLLDRDVGAYEAIHTSVRAVLTNPIPMAAWGLIVAVLLIVGSLPVFAGLAVVLPVLGHATWHVYRKVVEPAPSARNPV